MGSEQDIEVNVKVNNLTTEQIQRAAKFAVAIMKHPMFGRFPNPKVEKEGPQPLTVASDKPARKRKVVYKDSEDNDVK